MFSEFGLNLAGGIITLDLRARTVPITSIVDMLPTTLFVAYHSTTHHHIVACTYLIVYRGPKASFQEDRVVILNCPVNRYDAEVLAPQCFSYRHSTLG